MAPRRVKSAPGAIELNRHFGAETDLLDLQCTTNFAIYLLLFNWINPFVGKKTSQNFMRKKDDKVGKKKNSYKGKEKEKRAREKIVMDSQKGPNFMAYAHARKQKAA